MPWARRDLRWRVRAVLVVVAALGVAGIAFVALTFMDLLSARSRLADRLDPAALVARDWRAALTDQESGVRGYVLSGDRTFLAPDEQGRRAADAALVRLRPLLRDEAGLRGLVAQLEASMARWRRDAAGPAIAAVARTGARRGSEADLLRSRALFAPVRQQWSGLAQAFDQQRQVARHELNKATYRLIAAASIASLMVAASLVGVWGALRRWILDPLHRLGTEARAVAEGDLAHPVDGVGPPEMIGLAEDVEAMRRRILVELDEVEASRALLQDQAAELQRSNEELEHFAYVASHDLQEPLRKISGFCQLLQRRYEGQLDERADEFIAFAVGGANRMQQLINDLLAFSRVGRTTERFEPVALDRVVEQAQRSLGQAIEESGAIIEVGDLPTVNGDPVLLATLFQNLLGNAVKFRDGDAPRVEVTAAHHDGAVHLAVADDGIGIDPKYAEQVFVIFQRLHARDRYEGTGIGLALCRKVVEFHGGRIWIEPNRPRGTVVRVALPDGVALEGPSPR
ncbi:MAG: hypothetical protein JWN46_2709 [Acidimicrobiales bacterium]|nr:hypothetical protein [Acidimicrobiales bacterium]